MANVLLLSLVVLLAVVVFPASGLTCSYSCTKYSWAYKSCGTWGWGRCGYHKSYTGTCYRTCRNGGWTAWTTYSYSTCTKTCGTGYRNRYQRRSCTNPSPYGGGKSCYGGSTQSVRESCNTHSCKVNGAWSSWSYSSYGTCSVTCGGGTRTRTDRRTCSNPYPRYGGRACYGNSYKYTKYSCNTKVCIIHGGWSSWSSVSSGACSRSCGSGYQTRKYRRTCTNPVPKNGGRVCSGDNALTTVTACNTQNCPINGGWSCWTTTTGSCSKTCGRGVRVLTDKRTCTNPAPQYKGTACSGSSTRTRNEICNNLVPCGVDGGWSNYRIARVGRCLRRSNGSATQTVRFRRTCTNPAPKHGGAECKGTKTIVQKLKCNQLAPFTVKSNIQPMGQASLVD
ncbi:coadhesin-like isoform X2 [Littorina saxatilis]|uniref:coadhesin-like isoform X2 n=1 Tax=Littorina saxatilis TaxID=31220 RepID=UPI0038B45E52